MSKVNKTQNLLMPTCPNRRQNSPPRAPPFPVTGRDHPLFIRDLIPSVPREEHPGGKFNIKLLGFLPASEPWNLVTKI